MRVIFATYLFLMGLLSGCSSIAQRSPLAALERRMVYQPASFPADFPNDRVPFEDVDFTSKDGTSLHGWFADHPQPAGIVLLCHGNGGNIVNLGETLQILNRRHRLAVLAFDYRGYGKSQGKPTEDGILADARAARAWLAKRKDVSEQEIILMGRSLGGAVAIDLAAKDGAKGLVLASTFTSMPDVAQRLFPWIPTQWLMTQRFDSIEKIGAYHGPLLQTHGDADTLIPIEQGRRLYSAANGAKRFINIPGAGHNDPQPEEYRMALDEFLAQLND